MTASHSSSHPESGSQPGTVESVPAPDRGQSTGPRNLLRVYDPRQRAAGSDSPAATNAPGPDTNTKFRGTPPLTGPGTGFRLLIDYHPVSRSVPVEIEDRDATTFHRQQDEPRITSNNVIGAPMKKISHGENVAPDLRVVVRNDHPVQARTGRLSPSDLRVIDSGAGEPGEQDMDDLVERLTGEWASSFFRGEDNEDTVIDIRESRSLAASVNTRRSSTSGKDDEKSGLRLWTAEMAADEPVSRSSIETIRLFENYLPVEMDTNVNSEQDRTLGARQAVIESVRALRNLERAGGSEMSFSLRLHPEYLGHIEIEIQRLNDVWSVSIITAHDEARDVLTAEISRLENRFPRNDFGLDSVVVLTREPKGADDDSTGSEQSETLDLVGLGQRALGQLQYRD
ncbi:hypothetical protein BH23CHL2_BH23CHL2_30460 [soil metagenome]